MICSRRIVCFVGARDADNVTKCRLTVSQTHVGERKKRAGSAFANITKRWPAHRTMSVLPDVFCRDRCASLAADGLGDVGGHTPPGWETRVCIGLQFLRGGRYRGDRRGRRTGTAGVS